jgi:hypothetical protein
MRPRSGAARGSAGTTDPGAALQAGEHRRSSTWAPTTRGLGAASVGSASARVLAPPLRGAAGRGLGPLPDLAGLRLRRLGRGGLVSSVPFLQTTAYGRAVDESYSFTSPKLAPPFLLTNDVSSPAALPILRSIHRSYGWILPLGPHSLHPWSIDALTHRIARARSTLTTDSDYFDLSDPLSQLASTVSANKVTARRLLLVGRPGCRAAAGVRRSRRGERPRRR